MVDVKNCNTQKNLMQLKMYSGLLLKTRVDVGVPLRHLFLRIFLLASVAKMGTVAGANFRRNSSSSAQERPVPCCHYMQC